jgi:hypothetical protein
MKSLIALAIVTCFVSLNTNAAETKTVQLKGLKGRCAEYVRFFDQLRTNHGLDYQLNCSNVPRSKFDLEISGPDFSSCDQEYVKLVQLKEPYRVLTETFVAIEESFGFSSIKMQTEETIYGSWVFIVTLPKCN